MHKFLSICSENFQASILEESPEISFLDKIYSQEELLLDFLNEGFYEGKKNPETNAKVFLLPVINKDRIFEEYEEKLFSSKLESDDCDDEPIEEEVEKITTGSISSWMIRDHKKGVFFVEGINEPPKRKNYPKPKCSWMGMEEEDFVKPIKNVHGKKSHLSNIRTEKFYWWKEVHKIRIRQERKFKQKLLEAAA